jgi:long-subunit fatty acid transport protein
MTFLGIDVGARPAAMGGSFVCMDGDANALFWNPAGIANISGPELVANMTTWLADMKEHSFGLVYSLDRYGTVGISFLIMDNPQVHVVQFRGAHDWIDEGYQDLIHQHALGFAYAKQITDQFAIGGQIKWAHEDLGTFDYEDKMATEEVDGLVRALQVNDWQAKKDVLVFEFGTQYYTGYKDLRLGLAIRNFAPRTRYQVEYFELPLTFTLGMAIDLLSTFMAEEHTHKLTLSIDAIHPRDYSERIQIGGEYWYRDVVALRAGYKFNNDLESVAAGVGVKKTMGSFLLRLDYTYSAIGGIFSDVHRLSFGISK